jgi:hypothetical protein
MDQHLAVERGPAAVAGRKRDRRCARAAGDQYAIVVRTELVGMLGQPLQRSELNVTVVSPGERDHDEVLNERVGA